MIVCNYTAGKSLTLSSENREVEIEMEIGEFMIGLGYSKDELNLESAFP